MLEIISRFILLGQLYLLMYAFLQVLNRLETEAIMIEIVLLVNYYKK